MVRAVGGKLGRDGEERIDWPRFMTVEDIDSLIPIFQKRDDLESIDEESFDDISMLYALDALFRQEAAEIEGPAASA